MPEYYIQAHETIRYEYTVEAENEDQARQRVEDLAGFKADDEHTDGFVVDHVDEA